jgi:hypothetical protein
MIMKKYDFIVVNMYKNNVNLIYLPGKFHGDLCGGFDFIFIFIIFFNVIECTRFFI